MEHEVFVPVPADRLREALSDPQRVARAVPGLQHDAGTPPVAGRLKVRAAGHTITYRGALRVSGADDGSYVVEGDAAEVRGSGTVRLALTIRLTSAPEGTMLHFTGTATADGRVTELPADAVAAAMSRLLTRFAEKLGKAPKADADGSGGGKKRAAGKEKRGGERGPAAEEANRGGHGPEAEDETTAEPSEEGAAPGSADGGVPAPAPAEGRGDDREEATAPADADADTGTGAPAGDGAGADAGDGDRVDEGDDADVGAGVGEVPPASVFQAEVPPPSLDPFAENDFVAGGEPPAEAAHARRTMIGRSAEEVDHAPPRGRYAPVPAPETGSVGTVALRWAAPAAALAVASAVVVARALRRRR
ncbi:SRPBCC family protein [Streptomyces sp. HM190]|uniref:SRPBCC family protein n=1 Tax=Streptomyces sp. HM190 TaxID=2695266 RepID=UPI001916FD10|nr:SRPBCC family protein [Streptomyces sp. HM190]